jgi:hypothetical protein
VIGVFVFIKFLNEVNVVSLSMPRVLSFFGMPVAYSACCVDIITLDRKQV